MRLFEIESKKKWVKWPSKRNSAWSLKNICQKARLSMICLSKEAVMLCAGTARMTNPSMWFWKSKEILLFALSQNRKMKQSPLSWRILFVLQNLENPSIPIWNRWIRFAMHRIAIFGTRWLKRITITPCNFWNICMRVRWIAFILTRPTIPALRTGNITMTMWTELMHIATASGFPSCSVAWGLPKSCSIPKILY